MRLLKNYYYAKQLMKNKIIENAVNGTLNADFGETDAQLERQC